MASWGNVLRRGMELLGRPVGTTYRGGPPGNPPVRIAPTEDRARTIAYAPDPDGTADPGEIVWAWVPYEENDGRGKDRPLLVVGRSRRRRKLLGLMLSSQPDHAGDRTWVPVGSGAWDRQGRPSYVRLDRVLELADRSIRREGAVLDRARFDKVAHELRTRFGWR